MLRRRCEQHEAAGLRWPGLTLSQTGDPPGDAFAPVNVGYSGKCARQLILKEREVSAGKDDRVDTLTALSVEHRLHCRTHRLDRDRFTAKFPFGKFDQFGRAMTNKRAVGGESCTEVVDVRLPNGRLCAEDPDEPAPGNLGRGLNGRHCSDNRQLEC